MSSKASAEDLPVICSLLKRFTHDVRLVCVFSGSLVSGAAARQSREAAEADRGALEKSETREQAPNPAARLLGAHASPAPAAIRRPRAVLGSRVRHLAVPAEEQRCGRRRAPPGQQSPERRQDTSGGAADHHPGPAQAGGRSGVRERAAEAGQRAPAGRERAAQEGALRGLGGQVGGLGSSAADGGAQGQGHSHPPASPAGDAHSGDPSGRPSRSGASRGHPARAAGASGQREAVTSAPACPVLVALGTFGWLS